MSDTRLVIALDGVEICVETNCAPLLVQLAQATELLDRVDYAVLPNTDTNLRPVFEFHDTDKLDIEFHAGSANNDRLIARLPWGRIAHSTLIAMLLLLLAVRQQQRDGRFLLHASAVSKDGRALVIVGPSEAGKTTVAIDLCRRFGFALVGNDRIRLGLKRGVPVVLAGDRILNLRKTSLARYDTALANRFFPKKVGIADRGHKRRVSPRELGISENAGAAEIVGLCFVQLHDNQEALTRTDWNLHGPENVVAFLGRIELQRQITGYIRGGEIAPFTSDLGMLDVMVPNLDDRHLNANRLALIGALNQRWQTSLQGGLDDVARCLADEFERG